jgi:hypothetical protein
MAVQYLTPYFRPCRATTPCFATPQGNTTLRLRPIEQDVHTVIAVFGCPVRDGLILWSILKQSFTAAKLYRVFS